MPHSSMALKNATNFSISLSAATCWGLTLRFKRPPNANLWVGNLLIDLITADGPFLSAPGNGELHSAIGWGLARPFGRAPIMGPKITLLCPIIPAPKYKHSGNTLGDSSLCLFS